MKSCSDNLFVSFFLCLLWTEGANATDEAAASMIESLPSADNDKELQREVC